MKISLNLLEVSNGKQIIYLTNQKVFRSRFFINVPVFVLKFVTYLNLKLENLES